MDSLVSMALNQPVEQSARKAATNPYFTYAPSRRTYQRRVVRKVPVKRRAATRKAAAPQSIGVLKVAHCTSEYLKTVMNPFDSPAGACLPADMFPLPSQKLKVFLRGVCVLGTTGYGFCNASLVLSNDTTASATSTATSVMTSSTIFSAVTNLGTYTYAQLPWTIANVAANVVQGRAVALGLRVRYSGTEAGRNGTMLFYEDPDHASLAGLSYDTISQRVNAYTCRPPGDGSWETVLYSGPVNPNEVEFRNSDYLLAQSGAALVCVIKGIAGDTYEFEAFEHIEAIGVNTTGKSPSHSDAASYGKAQETLKGEASIKSLTVREEPSVISQFLHKVVQLAPFVIEQGSNIMKALDGNPMAILEGMASSAGLIYKSIKGRGDYEATQGTQGVVRPVPSMRPNMRM